MPIAVLVVQCGEIVYVIESVVANFRALIFHMSTLVSYNII